MVFLNNHRQLNLEQLHRTHVVHIVSVTEINLPSIPDYKKLTQVPYMNRRFQNIKSDPKKKRDFESFSKKTYQTLMEHGKYLKYLEDLF